jgi:protease-4
VKKGLGAILIAGIVVASLAIAALTGNGGEGAKKGQPAASQIGLVRVEGTISSGSAGLLGSSSAERVVKSLDKAAKDPTIKAVILRVNSPGGGVVASWEIGEAVKRVRAAGKPVVVSMGDSAASGGYWISAGADRIIASPGTMTGSIGVIMQTVDLSAIYQKIGYKTEVFKSGAYKDIGSPNRPMTDDERKIIQDILMETYEQFVQVVAEGRKMDPAKVRQIADGRILSGRQALELGLVDELGDMHRAVQVAAELAKLEGEPKVKELNGTGTLLDDLLGEDVKGSLVRGLMHWLISGRVEDGLPSQQSLNPQPWSLQ